MFKLREDVYICRTFRRQDLLSLNTYYKSWLERTVNWLILFFDIAFALVAAVLCTLGLNTFKAIKHLGIGKSFWIPVFVYGALFLIGSVAKIFHEVGVELDLLTINTDEIVHVSWLLALCTLMFSIYNYSRKVKTMRGVPIPDASKELTPIEKQATELLKRIEKLKNKKG